MYPDERGVVQNRLEELWRRVDDVHRSAKQRQAIFLQGIARLASAGLDRLFSPRLFSIQAIVVATCYTLASFLIFLSWLGPPTGGELRARLTLWTLVLTVFGTAPAFIRTKRFLRTWSLLLLLVLLYAVARVSIGRADVIHRTASSLKLFPFVVAGGIISDFLLITVARVTFRWSSASERLSKLTGLLLLNVVVGLGIIGPVLATLLLPKDLNFSIPFGHVFVFAVLVGTTNLAAAGVNLGVVALMMLALLHRLTWQLIGRSIYNAVHYKLIVKHPAVLFAGGVALCKFAITGNLLL